MDKKRNVSFIIQIKMVIIEELGEVKDHKPDWIWSISVM